MWKPGAAKPAGAASPGESDGDDDGDGRRRGKRADNPRTPTKESSAAKTKRATTKTLSGATMNMRFMKRRNVTTAGGTAGQRQQQQQQQQQQQGLLHPRGDGDVVGGRDAQMAGAESSEAAAGGDGNGAGSTDPARRKRGLVFPCRAAAISGRGGGAPSRYAEATPVDMYRSDALLGRRSFGGFNKSVESAARSLAAFHENGRSSDDNRGSRRRNETDEELLQRYQERIERSAKKKGRPVGNLDEKLKKKQERKQGGRKRKLLSDVT